MFLITHCVDLHLIDSTVKSICFILMGLLCTMALLCAAWTLHYWHRPIVKASQPIFLLLICGGIILQIFTIIPLSQDTQVEASSNDNACRWMVPLFSFGFCFTFASLFAKQFRVYIVFRRAAKMQHATQKGQFFFFRVTEIFFSAI